MIRAFNPLPENCPTCPVCGDRCYWHPGENSPEINSVSPAGWCCSECGDTLDETTRQYEAAMDVASRNLPHDAGMDQVKRMAFDILRAETATADVVPVIVIENAPDTRPPVPEPEERYIVQAWHWHADACGGPRWLFVCHDCYDRQGADDCAQRRIAEGSKVARIVRIPGGAA
jgi:hypothetical protein